MDIYDDFCPAARQDGPVPISVPIAQPAVSRHIPAVEVLSSALQMSMGGPGVNTTVTSHGTEGYYFVQQSESSDFSLTAQDSGQTSSGSSPYFNEGVMLRAGTGSAKAFYYAYVVGTNGTTLQGGIYVDYMSANGGSPTNLAMIPVSGQALPGSSSAAATCNAGGSATCKLGIERRTAPDGSKQLEAYWATSGSSDWRAIWGSMVTLQSTDALYSGGNVGLAATSDTSGSSSTANFASVSLASSSILDEYPAECPPGYQCAPVGGLPKRGQWAVPSNTWSSSPWTVSSGGAGLAPGNTSDGFHFIYQPMNGDGSVSAQVGPGYEFYAPTGLYGVAQYGVMVRGSTANTAPFFAAFVSPCQGLGIAYRTTTSGANTVTYKTTPPTCDSAHEYSGLGTSASIQVMVKRTGTSYQAYFNNGSGWTAYLTSQTISAIPSQTPAGAFVASTITGWQSWGNLSSVLVSSDTPTTSELLGSGGDLEATSSDGFSGPGNAFTGNFTQGNSDLSLSGRGLPLMFTWTYNSLLGSEPASTLAPYGNLGPGWTDNYNMYATKDTAGDVTVQEADGSAVTFAYNGSTYAPPTRVLASLVVNTGQTLAPNCPATALVLTAHDQTKYAFYQITATPPAGQPSGALCEERDINGYPTEMTYNSGNTQLTTVTECTTVSGTTCGTNRTLTLAYSGTEITSVTSSANAGTGTLKVSFTYNGSNQLATSADADGNSRVRG